MAKKRCLKPGQIREQLEAVGLRYRKISGLADKLDLTAQHMSRVMGTKGTLGSGATQKVVDRWKRRWVSKNPQLQGDSHQSSTRPRVSKGRLPPEECKRQFREAGLFKDGSVAELTRQCMPDNHHVIPRALGRYTTEKRQGATQEVMDRLIATARANGHGHPPVSSSTESAVDHPTKPANGESADSTKSTKSEDFRELGYIRRDLERAMSVIDRMIGGATT